MYGCCPGDNHNYSINTNRCTDRQTDIPTDIHIPTDVRQINRQTYNIRRTDRQRYQLTDIIPTDRQRYQQTDVIPAYGQPDKRTNRHQQMERQ